MFDIYCGLGKQVVWSKEYSLNMPHFVSGSGMTVDHHCCVQPVRGVYIVWLVPKLCSLRCRVCFDHFAAVSKLFLSGKLWASRLTGNLSLTAANGKGRSLFHVSTNVSNACSSHEDSFEAFKLTADLALTAANGKDRSFFHFGTYDRLVKLLYPLFSMPSRIWRYKMSADLQQQHMPQKEKLQNSLHSNAFLSSWQCEQVCQQNMSDVHC